MDLDTRQIVLVAAIGDKDGIPTIASVTFCESSASLTVNNLTVHIPWSELAQWQAWLAQRVEQES